MSNKIGKKYTNERSYFEFYENLTNKIIFRPPYTDSTNFKKLNTDRSSLIKIKAIDDDDKTQFLYYVHIFPKEKKTNKYIIFSHGNASDIYSHYNNMCYLSDKYGCNVICYDYMGYGLSTGKLLLNNCYISHIQIIDYVIHRNNLSKDDIILMGESLGTGIVVDFVYNQKKWDSPIILISPYKSIARIKFDIDISNIIDKVKTYKKINNINCPIKIIHGLDDELIDCNDHGRYLASLVKNPLENQWLEGFGHNFTSFIEKIDLSEIIY